MLYSIPPSMFAHIMLQANLLKTGFEPSGGGEFAGCADAVDIGEMSYSMVLVDDLNNDGKMDLVVSTMNGNVYVFGSPAPYHPLKSWTSQVRSEGL